MEQEKPKNSPKFYCEPCRYGTDSKSCYERHLKTTLHITGKRKERSDKIAYQCESPGCDYMSHNNLNYFVHILNCHSTKEERAQGYKYYCEKCDFGVFVKTAYDHHLETNKHKLKTI